MKFLYAFELDENMSLREIKEFIEVCGVYDETVKAAAGELIERHLMKENAFEMVRFCQLHNMKKAVQKCKSYIVNNFENDDILDIGLSDKGIDRVLLREIVGMKAEKTKIEETVSSVRGLKGFKMTFDSPKCKDPTIAMHRCIVDGIGLYVEPRVNVEINLYINDDCLFIGKLENRGRDSIVYVKFKDKQNFSLNSPTTKIEIDVKGNADIMINLSEVKMTSRLFVTERPTGIYGQDEKYGIIPEKCFKILKSKIKI